MKFPIPENETDRLATLNEYEILDTSEELAYDQLTQLAAHICQAPVSYISLIDDRRLWYKSRFGFKEYGLGELTEVPREVGFCAHTICQNDLLTVPDLSKDSRFADNPTVVSDPNCRFYCGMPLINPDGYALGTICVIDVKPRQLTADQSEAIRALANHVVSQFELRRNLAERKRAEAQLRQQNGYLAALHDTSLGLLNRLDLDELLETLIARASQLLDSPYGYIYLVDPKANILELKVAVGISERQIGDRMQPGEGLAGKVWQSGQPVVVADYDSWPGRSPEIRYGLIQALAGVPLTHTTMQSTVQVVGVLGLGFAADSGRTFGDDELELLSRFAQLASIALDNARLFEETQQANQELAQALDNLKATQAQLVETEKMAALGQLVAGVAHEINTPVGVGVTAASLLEDKTAAFRQTYQSGQMKRADLEKYLDTAGQSSQMILHNLNRAAELIQSFKQVAVDQSSEDRREFQVKQYLEEILLSLQPQLKKTQHTININSDETLTLDSYPGVFSQIVTNLVMNSLLHAYEPDEAGQLSFDFRQENGRVIFEYADDGRGIPKENLDKIFDPFFTTRRGQGGSGLGLHIIYNLVTQKLGGMIRCESEVSQGTRFVIELPPS